MNPARTNSIPRSPSTKVNRANGNVVAVTAVSSDTASAAASRAWSNAGRFSFVSASTYSNVVAAFHGLAIREVVRALHPLRRIHEIERQTLVLRVEPRGALVVGGGALRAGRRGGQAGRRHAPQHGRQGTQPCR